MLMEVRLNNVLAFNKPVVFSTNADMRTKKFISNVHQEDGHNIVKSTAIYGPNNTGKTCLIKGIASIIDILLNNEPHLLPNLFTHNPICKLGIAFLYDKKKYDYTITYDTQSEEIIYEHFVHKFYDEYGNEKSDTLILKDIKKQEFKCIDPNVEPLMEVVANKALLCHAIDTSKFSKLAEIKHIITEFARSIDIINMNNIPIDQTIKLLKNENNIQKKVVNFIKQADVYLDDFKYAEADMDIKLKKNGKAIADERALALPEQLLDQLKLISVYKGHPVPSMVFDSTGTKKIAALASYIIEALEKGRTLIVDELDSSLHFSLTRAIVALFNNELNDMAQLIFTVHDVTLLDCKRLFRKEQIWFVHKDEEQVYLYSLADFTTANTGIRDSTNLLDKYKKGVLGALPDPSFFDSLLEIKSKY